MKAKIFFLPIETRPESLPPLKEMKGKFWHTGVIVDGKVYECFNHGRHAIGDYDDRKAKELEDMRAVLVETEIDQDKLKSEIGSGTSCGGYVARVVGLSEETGNVKEYWTEEVYNLLIKRS